MNIVIALDLALSLLIEAQKIQALIAQAQGSGRTDLTDAQMAEVVADADAAKQRLEMAIANARGNRT